MEATGLGNMKQAHNQGTISGWGFTTGGDAVANTWGRNMNAGTSGAGDSQNLQPYNVLNCIIKI